MKPHRKRRAIAATSLVSVLLVSACSGGSPTANTPASGSASASAPANYNISFPSDLLAQAKQAALDATGGQKLAGTKVEIAGLNGGFEEATVEAALKAFSDATGVAVQYTGGSNVETRVQTRVKAGNPPDIAQEGGLWNLLTYAKQGKVTPVSDVIDADTLKKNFDAGVLSGMTINGKVYSVPVVVNPQEVWYNPQTFTDKVPASLDDLVQLTQQKTVAGATPWCMGLQSFSPAAYFIEDIFAKTYGAPALDAWAKGDIKWTSDQVKAAFQEFGKIATDKQLYGGIKGALGTGSSAAAGLPYQTPSKCQMIHWGSYTGGIILNQYPKLDRDTQVKFFDLPPASPQYAGNEQVSGWTMYMFNDRPEVRSLVKYLASAPFQALLANSGSWVAANKQVPLSAYPSSFSKAAAEQVMNAKAISFGPMFQTRTPVFQAFLDGIGKYVNDPASLNDVLSTIQDAADSNP